MGCVIKIKEREEYKVFESEEAMRKYLKNNNIEAEEDKEGNKFVSVSTTHEAVCSMLTMAHNKATEEIGNDIDRMKINDWNVEEYQANSMAISLSTLLGNMMIKNGDTMHRLFPEFISSNYLNVVIQNEICKAYLESINKLPKLSSEQDLAVNTLRREIFEDLPTNKRDAKLRSAKEWLEYFNLYNKEQFNLSSELLEHFDNLAQEINEINFEAMLRGEVLHTIFDNVTTKSNSKISKIEKLKRIENAVNKLFSENGLFKTRYGEDYDEVPNSISVIERLFSGHDNVKSIKELLPSYIQFCENQKKFIEDDFKSKGAKNITWFSETRVTGDLDENGINTFGKSKIRGKIDAIIVVDGVAHIIDFKVSKHDYNAWPQEKKLKTSYQLATYRRLLQKMGINVSQSTVSVVAIQVAPDGSITDNSSRKHINTSGSIDSNISTYLKHIEEVSIKDTEIYQRVNGYIEQLFGVTSAKALVKSSVDSLIKSLSSRLKENKDGTFSLNYSILNPETLGYDAKKITNIKKSDLEDKLKEIAQTIFEANQKRSGALYSKLIEDLKNYFISDSMDITEFACLKGEAEKELVKQYIALFSKYKNSGAKIIHSELASKFNIILIETSAGIDVINCLAVNPKVSWNIENKDSKLFDNISGMRQSNLSQSVHNVHTIQSLLVLNELLAKSDKKIGQIISLQLGLPVADFTTISKMKEDMLEPVFEALSLQGTNISQNIFNTSFADPFENVFYAFSQFLNQMNGLRGNVPNLMGHPNISAEKKQQVEDIFTNAAHFDPMLLKSSNFSNDDKVAILQAMLDQLMREYPNFFKKDGTPELVNEVTSFANHLISAITFYQGNEFVVESDIHRYSINGGYETTSMDRIPEENVQTINRITSDGFEKVGTRHNKFVSICRVQRDNFLKANGYTKGRQMLIGDVVNNYTDLFERDADGNLIDGDLKFKNPWSNPSLKEHQREFIKFILWSLNRHSYSKKHGWKSYKDIKESQLHTDDYYCPLMRAKGMDRFRDPNGGINLPLFNSEWYKENFRRMRNSFTETENLLGNQFNQNKDLSNTLESLYNQHETRTDPRIRRELIEHNGGIENFSMDIETLLYSFTLAQDMKEVFDTQVLPQVRSILYAASFQANVTGMEMPNFDSFVRKYMKSAVYGSSIVESPELQQAFKYIGPLRSAGAAIALSYNVMNIPRELLTGMFTNISRAMFNSYGGETFSLTDYMKAFSIVSMDVPNFVMNITKIELLNEYYRFSNMSINEIPEQVTSNKTGIFALGSRFASWSLVAPDYFNRMTMFIAQMIHDGCWEAHEIKKNSDGSVELVYDMSKDQRFEVLWKYQNAYIPKTETRSAYWDYSKIPNNLHSTFNEQLSLYEIMRNDLNKESEEKIETDKFSALTRAYTNKQRDSLKSFADTAFGYYDRETKANFFKTAIGLTFKQFMAYMSAMKTRYFLSRTNNTARGAYKQLEDTRGRKIWTIRLEDNEIKTINDDMLNGEYSQYKHTAKPKLAWQGTYLEGIVQSYVNLIKELSGGTIDLIKGNGAEAFKRIYKEYIKSGDIRHSNLLEGLYDLMIGILFPVLLKAAVFDDPEETGISYRQQYRNLDAQNKWLYTIGVATFSNFNIFATLYQGFFVWEIPSFTILLQAIKNFFNAFGDDDLNLAEEALVGTVNSVGAFRVFKPIVEEFTDV